MSTWGIAMMRDEADVAEAVVRHMADEVDGVLVADNGSTDGTRDILRALQDELPNVFTQDDFDPAYYQSQKMTALAEQVHRDNGAVWVVPFDADEIWFAEDRISTVLTAADLEMNIAPAVLTNHYVTSIDAEGNNPFQRMVWRAREPGRLPKVAVRWEDGAVIHQGNHGATVKKHMLGPELKIRHFPYRSVSQFVSKARNGAAAYKLTDLPEDQGNHWRAYGGILERLGEEGIAEVFKEHFFYLSPVDSGLVHDPAPYLRWR